VKVGGVLTGPVGKSYPWAVGLFFGNTEPAMELWSGIAGGFTIRPGLHPSYTNQPMPL